MDLHIVGAEPTAEERDAVDALLGPPESGWAGGVRDVARDGRAGRAGLAQVKERRDLLLPSLHAVQDRVGWISRGALNYICRRLIVPPAEAWGVVTFYHLFNTQPAPRTVVHVCDDIACRLHGAEEICSALAARDDVKRSPCLGQCERAPAALIVRAGDPVRLDTATGIRSAEDLLAAVDFRAATADKRDAASGGSLSSTRSAGRLASVQQYVPWAGTPDLKLLRRVGVADPTSLDDYRAHGGYRALARAFAMGPDAVIGEVTKSNLLGRGGAAFPTGRKWEAVAREPATPRYLVCNADESEPGTFKDRVLLEDDPFAIVEAMTIAAFAARVRYGFMYVRGEYPDARTRVQHAIDSARSAGLLGDGILGSDFSFDIEIRRGAGAYICGEETALFNSLEGKRGEPRSKPPFPAQVGLFGRPTVVNNVETLVNVLDIVLEGGEAWARVGTPASTGTRLFCLSGHVARPGLYELPFGRTLGELLEMAGGVAGGKALQAILLGGAAGTFVGPDALSLRLTFEDVRAAGATLGSGVVMVFDTSVDLRDTLLRIAKFMEDESCGQCVPCRVGTVRQVEILQRLAAGGDASGGTKVPPSGVPSSGGTKVPPSGVPPSRGTKVPPSETDLATLAELGQAMRDASICGLGQTASSAVESAIARLHLFRGPS